MGAQEPVALVEPDLAGGGDPPDTVVRRVVEEHHTFARNPTGQFEGGAVDVDKVDTFGKVNLPRLGCFARPRRGDVEIRVRVSRSPCSAAEDQGESCAGKRSALIVLFSWASTLSTCKSY